MEAATFYCFIGFLLIIAGSLILGGEFTTPLEKRMPIVLIFGFFCFGMGTVLLTISGMIWKLFYLGLLPVS